MFDIIGPKSANHLTGGVTPWQQSLAVGKDIFDLYESKGDLVSTAAVNIPSVQDGPGVVVMYDDLTLNHVMSTTNRCRSLTVLVKGNLVINNGGGISMTARGARGHAGMGLYDGYIPASIGLTSRHLLLADVLQYVKDNAIDVTDRWFWDDFAKVMGVTATFNQGGALVLLTAANCGVGKEVYAPTTYTAGITGGAGTNGGCGGGGTGGASIAIGYRSGSGRPWGGGAGSAGAVQGQPNQLPLVLTDDYGGAGGNGNLYSNTSNSHGGGAGNPGGRGGETAHNGQDGTGGVLRVIVKGSVTINSGGILQADGMNGGSIPGAFAGGGGSGGGHISIIYGGTFTNNGTARANGGTGGTATGYAPGGAGGAGSVVTKTFAQMGW